MTARVRKRVGLVTRAWAYRAPDGSLYRTRLRRDEVVRVEPPGDYTVVEVEIREVKPKARKRKRGTR